MKNTKNRVLHKNKDHYTNYTDFVIRQIYLFVIYS